MKFAVAETNGHLARCAGEEAAAKPLALHLIAHDFDSTATTQAAIALQVRAGRAGVFGFGGVTIKLTSDRQSRAPRTKRVHPSSL